LLKARKARVANLKKKEKQIMKKIISIASTGLALVSGALAQTSFTTITQPGGASVTQSQGHYNFGGGYTSDYRSSISSAGPYENAYKQNFPSGSVLSGASGSTGAGEYHSATDNVYNFGGGYNSEYGHSISSTGATENTYKQRFPNGPVQAGVSGTTSDGHHYNVTDNTYTFGTHSMEVISGTTANGEPIYKVINR
jgi:hypothetical protein